jgi:peptide subunit release factor RF-3
MAQRGIEGQTRKLFEVCRLRDLPIITFVNKPDREARDPFDLLDEIEQSLALDVTPASWPIGMGRDFLGTYDLFADALLLFERGVHDRVTEPVRCSGLDDPKLPRWLPKTALTRLRVPNHGSLRIGDTLPEGETLRITGIRLMAKSASSPPCRPIATLVGKQSVCGLDNRSLR